MIKWMSPFSNLKNALGSVKIEGCDTQQNACKIKDCLSYYGEPLYTRL